MTFAEWWNSRDRQQRPYPGRKWPQNGKPRKGRKALKRRNGRN